MENKDIKYIIGVEIGSSRAKIGVAGYEVGANGEPAGPLTIYDIETLPTVDAVRYGRITNVKEVTETLTYLVDKIEKCSPIAGRKIDGVYIGVGGRTLKSTLMGSRIQLPDRREITEDLIQRLKEDVASRIPTDREILAIQAVRFTVDNIPTPRPVGTLGTRLAGEFTVVTCDPSNVRDFRTVLLDRMSIGVCGSSVLPIAIANLVLTETDAFSGCMLVDIGAETITTSIYKGGSLIDLATIPLGSRLITRDLSTRLGVPEDEAENIKIRMGSALADTDSSDSLQQAVESIISARLKDLIANIEAQPGYAGLKAADLPGGIILTGGGAKLKHFSRVLESWVGMKVRTATVPSRIAIADSSINTADSVDIIALLHEAAFESRDPDVPDCLAPLPKAEPKPVTTDLPVQKQVEKEEPEIWSEEPEDVWTHPGYQYERAFGDDDDQDLLKDDPMEDYYENPEEDDDFVLLDDDDAEAKRRRINQVNKDREISEKYRRERERKKQAREKKKAEEKERKKGIPSRIDIFISKVANFVGKNSDSDDEGADLDD